MELDSLFLQAVIESFSFHFNTQSNVWDHLKVKASLSQNATGIRLTSVIFVFKQMSVHSKIHLINTLQSSSCLSDRDEEDIYDLAAKYEGSKVFGDKHRFFGSPAATQKLKLSPSG